MTTQQLFGECCIVRERVPGGWIHINTCYDEEEGWCLENQVTQIDLSSFNLESRILTGEWTNCVRLNGSPMMVPFGSSLTAMSDGIGNWRDSSVLFEGATIGVDEKKPDPVTMRELALMFLNSPYLWGGKSVYGVDCSGFVQSIYKCVNFRLKRNSHQQVLQGEVVNFLQEARCGDLAFFDNEEGRIIHVGMLLNDHEIIHAAGMVRIDRIDNMGILRAEDFQRTHRLRIIKRMFTAPFI